MLTNISALLRTVRCYGDNLAIIDPEGCCTWAQFADRVARAAGLLNSMGVGRGERYAIASRNSFRNLELVYAGYWSGAVPVPINYRLAPAEISDILDNAECKLLFFEDVVSDLLRASELSAWADRVVLVSAEQADGAEPQFEALLQQAPPAEIYDCAEEDDALIVYTGGTTGRSKGVRLSHRNIVSNALQIGFEISPRSDDIYLHVVPMFHSASLLSTAYLITGGAQAFLPRFSPQSIFDMIQNYGITATMMTPSMLIELTTAPDFDSYDLSSLRQIFYGASPMAVEWIEKILARFPGVELHQGYGLTETSPMLTILSMAEHEKAVATGSHEVLRSAGRQIPGVDMRIVDEWDHDVVPGSPGEIAVRGPNVCKGYLNCPEQTAAAFRNGWFYTGDVGCLDEKGFLYLLDRKNDVIITGGEKVYSSEVEAVLYKSPKVHECAVIGVPDDRYGETLLAAVVAAAGETLTKDELIAHCRGKIGGYKIPRRYVFLEKLPKSAAGKILKTELRQIYGAEF